jgi:hypothetical protein
MDIGESKMVGRIIFKIKLNLKYYLYFFCIKVTDGTVPIVKIL